MPAHAAPRRAPALPARTRRGKHAAPRSTSRTVVVPGVALTATGGFVALSGSAAGSPARPATVEVRPVALPAWTGAAAATPAVATPVLPVLPAPQPERASRSADRTAPGPAVVRPVDGPVTSGFGKRWGRLHAGLDFGVPVGTEVRAAQAGTVQSVTFDRGGYGKHVVLVHPDGTTTLYGHLSQVLVTGGSVAAGQVFALSGNTGHSTGPHLHFEVRGADGPVDPRAWLVARGVEL